MDELLKQLEEAITNLKPFSYSKDGLNIKVDSDNNTLAIKVEYKEDITVEKERNEFIDYLESLDDDLFLEICEYLEVSEVQNSLYSNDIEEVRSAILKFKSVADEIIESKIKYLTSCLSKSHK